jgi:hypothetical protein
MNDAQVDTAPALLREAAETIMELVSSPGLSATNHAAEITARIFWYLRDLRIEAPPLPPEFVDNDHDGLA